MTNEEDRRYFCRRARDERERALAAADSSAATVHHQLAAAYERLLGTTRTSANSACGINPCPGDNERRFHAVGRVDTDSAREALK